jgi:hypothetical protein
MWYRVGWETVLVGLRALECSGRTSDKRNQEEIRVKDQTWEEDDESATKEPGCSVCVSKATALA